MRNDRWGQMLTEAQVRIPRNADSCGSVTRRFAHSTPLRRSSLMRASGTPRRPKISALCWPSLGATLRTRTPSPILTGVRMCGTSPSSGSLAYLHEAAVASRKRRDKTRRPLRALPTRYRAGVIADTANAGMSAALFHSSCSPIYQRAA
jgi:hypothetical protein